jgi:ElaB/YqjD/DUF883 family membrane-anchored ribosome-binding protein
MKNLLSLRKYYIISVHLLSIFYKKMNKALIISMITAFGLMGCGQQQAVKSPNKTDILSPNVKPKEVMTPVPNVPAPGIAQPRYTDVRYDKNPTNITYIIQSIFSGQRTFMPNNVAFVDAKVNPAMLVKQRRYEQTLANERYLKSMFGPQVRPQGFSVVCSTLAGASNDNILFGVFERGELLGMEVRKPTHPWSTRCGGAPMQAALARAKMASASPVVTKAKPVSRTKKAVKKKTRKKVAKKTTKKAANKNVSKAVKQAKKKVTPKKKAAYSRVEQLVDTPDIDVEDTPDNTVTIQVEQPDGASDSTPSGIIFPSTNLEEKL